MKNKIISEFLGTTILVLVGTGTVVFGLSTGGNDNLGVALAFGLVLMSLIYVLGSYSGCHLNPAVSIAFYIVKRMRQKELLCYIAAQISGAVFGSGLIYLILRVSDGDMSNLGQNSTTNIGMMGSFIVELLVTAVFVYTILSVTGKKELNGIAGLIIGLTLTSLILMVLPLTGASFNPARSIGPAIWSGKQAILDLGVFIIAPILGAAVAAIIYRTQSEIYK